MVVDTDMNNSTSDAYEPTTKQSYVINPVTGTTNGVCWHVYQGDACATLKQLPGNLYNCAITSPPYYSLRDYGVDNQIGLEETVEEYVESILLVMDEIYRVLHRNGFFSQLG